jgi:ribosomal protein S16
MIGGRYNPMKPGRSISSVISQIAIASLVGSTVISVSLYAITRISSHDPRKKYSQRMLEEIGSSKPIDWEQLKLEMNYIWSGVNLGKQHETKVKQKSQAEIELDNYLQRKEAAFNSQTSDK